MKNQVVETNFMAMMYAGIMYTGLVISGWLLMRLTIACFKLPSALNSEQMNEITRQLKESIEQDERTDECETENVDSSSDQYFDTTSQDDSDETTLLYTLNKITEFESKKLPDETLGP